MEPPNYSLWFQIQKFLKWMNDPKNINDWDEMEISLEGGVVKCFKCLNI